MPITIRARWRPTANGSIPTNSASNCCATSSTAGTRGKFGPEFDDCEDIEEKRRWNKDLGLGRQKIFEVRRVHNDITFIDTFLTPEFCVEHKLFSFAYVEQTGQYVIESREFRPGKEAIVVQLDELRQAFYLSFSTETTETGVNCF